METNQYLIDYYNNKDEDGRLAKRFASVEFLTTMHFLSEHLPKGCTVLDCCAASGAYAFPLAKAGYRVTAGDLIQKHVDILNVEYHLATCEQPSILGHSMHGLWIGKKK